MSHSNWITTLACVTALGVATPSAADPCPANQLCVAGQACESLTAVSAAREANFDGGIWAFADYDWSAASCRAIAQLPFWSPTSLDAKAEATEDFVVTGIPPGTPLTIHARARLVASAGPSGGTAPSNHAAGWLEEAGTGRDERVVSVEGAGSPVSIDHVLALDFANLAGAVFRLTIGARSDAREGTSRATVTLTFVDLPPGAVVSSCHASTPVPTTPVTWGHLKSLYR